MTYPNNVIEHFLWRELNLPQEENPTPKYMIDMVNHYLNTDGYVKNIMAFRGSGKSINTCILALERVASGKDRFVMIVSDTMTQAEALIADIQTLVEDGDNKIKITRAIAGRIEFLVNGQSACIMGVGAGMSLRGRKFKRLRATLIITDDLMNDQIAMNRLRMSRLSRWMYKVLIPSMNPKSELWNVGTPLNAGDIFMSMVNIHGALEIPLNDEAWPDRFSPEWIAAKKQEYNKAGMIREYKQEFELVLTDSETALFDMKKIRYCAEDEVPEDLEYYMTLDGAFSEKDSADYSSFAILGVDKNGHWYVDSRSLRGKPTEIVSKLFEYQNRCGALDIGIEKGSWLLSMKSEVEQKMLDYQQYFNVVELNTNGSKISRIKALTHIVNSGRLTIIDNGEESEMLVDQMELTDEIACNASHDDALDAMAQLCQLDIINSDSLLNEHLAASEEDNQTTIYDYED